MVFLEAAGNVPSAIDLLSSSSMNEASISTCHTMIRDGTRSMLHVLLGVFHKGMTSSSFVTDAKHSSVTGERRWMFGVKTMDSSRMSSSFWEEKKFKIIRCVISNGHCTRVSTSESGEFCHSFLEFPRPSLIYHANSTPPLFWTSCVWPAEHHSRHFSHGNFRFLVPLLQHSDAMTFCTALTVEPWWSEFITNLNSSFRTMFVKKFRERCVA